MKVTNFYVSYGNVGGELHIEDLAGATNAPAAPFISLNFLHIAVARVKHNEFYTAT